MVKGEGGKVSSSLTAVQVNRVTRSGAGAIHRFGKIHLQVENAFHIVDSRHQSWHLLMLCAVSGHCLMHFHSSCSWSTSQISIRPLQANHPGCQRSKAGYR